MRKIPSWVWLAAAGIGAYFLYQKYKTPVIALTSANASPTGQALPGTPAAISQAGQQISTGLTQLFQNV
jgi:hypothetical protein